MRSIIPKQHIALQVFDSIKSFPLYFFSNLSLQNAEGVNWLNMLNQSISIKY